MMIHICYSGWGYRYCARPLDSRDDAAILNYGGVDDAVDDVSSIHLAPSSSTPSSS
jgi:hypothetical protein